MVVASVVQWTLCLSKSDITGAVIAQKCQRSDMPEGETHTSVSRKCFLSSGKGSKVMIQWGNLMDWWRVFEGEKWQPQQPSLKPFFLQFEGATGFHASFGKCDCLCDLWPVWSLNTSSGAGSSYGYGAKKQYSFGQWVITHVHLSSVSSRFYKQHNKK